MRDVVVAFRAALLGTALEALGRFAWGGPYLPELMAQKFFALIPAWAFTPLFRTFGYNSKYYAFAGMIAAELAGLTMAGALLRKQLRRRMADHDYKGYWQARGWTDTAAYKTFSRIDVPAAGATLKQGERSWLAGIAFAGSRGIRAVEVSMDGGKTWQPARVKPVMGDHTWALWGLEWTPAIPGSATLMVRAVDGTGAPQPVGPTPPLPDGVEGIHTLAVRVA